MKPFPTAAVHGVGADTAVLTLHGWAPLREVPIGTHLAHPHALNSKLLAMHETDSRVMVRIDVADRTSLIADAEQPLQVTVGTSDVAKPRRMHAYDLLTALERGELVRLPRYSPYVFGRSVDLPLDPWLCGALLGDGYLRRTSVQWCNEQPQMHALVSAALPPGATLTPLRYGQADTGSATIIGTSHRDNPVLRAVRQLGLAGCRAWEKFIPPSYLNADLEARQALFSGLMDTDASIDQVGRMEFGTSSERLGNDMLTLIHGLGGRATLTRRDNITFTSPRQATPKAGRPCYRLTNIRMPNDIMPFRRSDRASRLRPFRTARHWKIVDVTCISIEPALAVSVTAPDDLWIAQSGFSLVGSAAAGTSAAAA